MSEAKATRDHAKIKAWAEARGGRPATVAATAHSHDAGILRLDFEPKDEAGLERISWEDFFKKFDEEGLVFLFQDKTADGSESRFNKFVDQATAAKTAEKAH